MVISSCAMYIHTFCSYLKPLDYSLKPWETRISSNDNLPWQSYQHSTLSANLPHTKVIPSLQCYIQIFHLPSCCQDHTIMMNVSLDTTNINTINISTVDFRIWQYFSSNWTPPHLQKLVNVPEVPDAQLYRDVINTSELIHSFTIKDDGKYPSLIWTILMHSGTYIGTTLIIFCCTHRCLLL